MEEFKYWHNLLSMPFVAVMLVVGILGVLYGIVRNLFSSQWRKGIWYSGAGTILFVFSLFMLAGLNNTAFYPSTYDLQSSLTISNSSSSHYTLTAMSYVSLMVPFVIAYIVWAWRSINNKRIDSSEMESEEHVY